MSLSANACVSSGVRSTRPAADELHQAAHALLAARTERGDDAMVAEAGGERVVGHLQLARVDAQARERAAGAQAAQRVLERLLRAERLDRHVGAAAGQRLDLGDDVLAAVVEHDVGAHPPRHRQPRVVAVDADDQRRAHQLGARGRAQADRTLGEHDDRVADPDAARLGAAEAGRRDVGKQDDLLVA